VAFEVRNEESWHDELCHEVWKSKTYIVKLLKNFWKVEMKILGHSDLSLRSFEDILLNLTWKPTFD